MQPSHAQEPNHGAQQAPAPNQVPYWKRFLGALIAVAIVIAVRLLPGDLGIRISAGIAAGLVAGLLPYFVGRNRNRKLATAALLVSGAIGAYGGLLYAVPAAVVMTLVLWLAVKPANTGQAGVMPGQAGAPGPVGVPGQAGAPGQIGQQGYGQAPQAGAPGQMGQVNAQGQYGYPAQQGQAPQPAPYGHTGQAGQAPQQGQHGASGQETQPGQWPVR